MPNAIEADLLPEYEARIAAPERLVAARRSRSRPLKGGSEKRTVAEKRAYIRDRRPDAIPVRRGCEMMNIPRSSLVANPERADEDPVMAEIGTIAETCRGYGYRRLTAGPRHRGRLVNSKRVRRVRRENDSPDRFLALLAP